MIAAPPFVGFLLAAAGSIVVLTTGQGTPGSAVAGFVAACLLVLGFGVPVMAPLTTFVLGSGILTRMGRRIKERSHSAEPNRGRRTASQVAAKLGVPALLGIVAALGGGDPSGCLVVAATASLAGAFADTAATEIGPLGKGPVVRWNGPRLERASHGTVGGMSLAGLAGGAAASALVALVAWVVGLVGIRTAGVAAVAGFAASGIESIVAATPVGVRLGHGGRNVLVSATSAAIAAAIHWGGIR